ncbi:hypothetical protein T265_02405 [Opisthorchis viverrini]|uniref:Uncharacterized protein n=1 Tax=Opisthorchis viverrini TaxID=6198 RepID=A0A074ZW52_OPIVI|nr:hypothetical protein T265_02405 [Opisthorchis viverrini]KER31356.1 hypothetical protein T265_02405 [Opisthorchis viverrini]
MSSCTEADIIQRCGNYTDLPPDWGNEKLTINEVALIVVGILVDVLTAFVFIFVLVFKFNEEVRRWFRTRMKEKVSPYEKVADYLRGTELEPGSFKRRDPSYSISVGEVEQVGELLERRPTIMSAQERDRSSRSSQSVYTSSIRTSGIEQGEDRKPASSLVHFYRSPSIRSPHHSPKLTQRTVQRYPKHKKSPSPNKPQVLKRRKPRPLRRRGRTRRHPSISAFLPLSRARPKERLLYESDSGSSSPSGIKLRRLTAAPEICQTRTMPKWDAK